MRNVHLPRLQHARCDALQDLPGEEERGGRRMTAAAAARMPDETGTLTIVVTRSSIAPLNGESRISSPQVSQSLGGHPLRVLAEEGDWLRVRGLDDYEGWINRGYTAALPPAADGTALRIDG